MRAIAVERGQARGASASDGLHRFRELLSKAAEETDSWRIGDESFELMLASLRGTYRSGLRLGLGAFRTEDADEMHDLRSRVIDLFHQCELFQGAWTALFSAHLAELHRLRTALGDHNDLTMLGEFALSRLELPHGVAEEILDRVLSNRRPIERRAREQFERLYAERPGAFMRRMRAYLAHPRKRDT